MRDGKISERKMGWARKNLGGAPKIFEERETEKWEESGSETDRKTAYLSPRIIRDDRRVFFFLTKKIKSNGHDNQIWEYAHTKDIFFQTLTFHSI